MNVSNYCFVRRDECFAFILRATLFTSEFLPSQISPSVLPLSFSLPSKLHFFTTNSPEYILSGSLERTKKIYL